ncbi:hypothetical protein DL771_009153 [Monosporascus sp. 5C6A]|nr:hypothetical protein DL771_009153 [Monosporascus sp. 5C6A]
MAGSAAILNMDALSSSSQLAVAAQPKSILKKPLKVQTSKKCVVVDGVARDIVTGEEVPQSAVDSASSRALEKRQRHEEGQALLRARPSATPSELRKTW